MRIWASIRVRSIRLPTDLASRVVLARTLLFGLIFIAACQPLRADEFKEVPPTPSKPVANEIILTLGRRYGVAASGTGVQLRVAPDPNSATVESLRFATVVAITAEASGSDGKTWRRVDNRGWATRDGLFVFTSLRDAMNLAIELRVYSSPTVRASLSVYERPSASTATAVPGKPVVSPAQNQVIPPIFYGVIIKPETIEYARPGDTPRPSPPLGMGFTSTVVSEGIGVDGFKYNRLENDSWVRSDAMAIYANLPEATGAAYRATMEALAPGIEIHPNLAPALWLLHQEPRFRYLADTIRESKIPIKVARIPDPGVIGSYSLVDRAISFSEQTQMLDVRVLTATLAHEANHVWEARQGVSFVEGTPCLDAELRAFRIQAAVWEKFFGEKGKEAPANDAEKDLNEMVRLFKQDSELLKSRLLSRYAKQCGYNGPLPSSSSVDLTPRTDATPVVGGMPVKGAVTKPGPNGTPIPATLQTVGTPGAGLPANPPIGVQLAPAKPGGAPNPIAPANQPPLPASGVAPPPAAPPAPNVSGPPPVAPGKIAEKPVEPVKPPAKP